MTEPTSDAKTVYVLEHKARLSESFLWFRQRRFYEGQGIAAWSSAAIPNHVTTNPLIARAYARLVVAWLRDLQGSTTSSRASDEAIFDPTQPVYVVEIGSGPGRFGFFFLRQLTRLLEKVDAPCARVTYVMTDVAEQNLAFLRNHPNLQPYVEAGMLDFARFDAENPGEIELLHSGVVLSPDAVRNPIVCVANYVFDSIRQDLFSVDRGEFREMLMTLSLPQAEENLDDPGLLERLTISFDPHQADVEYYDDPEFNTILRSYLEELPNVAFLFPLAALRCIRYLSQLSGGRMLLLSSDKGFDRADALMGQGGPGLGVHSGAFSLMVNYEAIGRYILNRGGQFLRASHRDKHLDTVACVLGIPQEDTRRLREAFDEYIDELGPDHAFTIAVAVRSMVKELPIEETLAGIRYANWDPLMLMAAAPELMTKVGSATMNQKADLADVIRRTWEEYYYIGEQPDGAMVMGVLLRHMQYFREALTLLERSLQLSGPKAQTYYEIGVCFYELQDRDQARQFADRALEIDPNCGEARALRLRIEADEARHFGGPSLPAPLPPTPAPAAPVKEPVG